MSGANVQLTRSNSCVPKIKRCVFLVFSRLVKSVRQEHGVIAQPPRHAPQTIKPRQPGGARNEQRTYAAVRPAAVRGWSCVADDPLDSLLCRPPSPGFLEVRLVSLCLLRVGTRGPSAADAAQYCVGAGRTSRVAGGRAPSAPPPAACAAGGLRVVHNVRQPVRESAGSLRAMRMRMLRPSSREAASRTTGRRRRRASSASANSNVSSSPGPLLGRG